MPKETEYKIEWSQALVGYEVIHGPFRFPLKETTTLLHWLGMVNAFHFCSPTDHTLTVRKESKQRGGGYWYAYKRVNGKVHKKYLGKESEVTLALLETLAQQFVEPAPSPQLPPEPPPRQPTLTFTKTLESALHIYGFASIPTRKALIDKYRELSKQHHPDRGGIHEDMVAVNLAYDYLKKCL